MRGGSEFVGMLILEDCLYLLRILSQCSFCLIYQIHFKLNTHAHESFNITDIRIGD